MDATAGSVEPPRAAIATAGSVEPPRAAMSWARRASSWPQVRATSIGDRPTPMGNASVVPLVFAVASAPLKIRSLVILIVVLNRKSADSALSASSPKFDIAL